MPASRSRRWSSSATWRALRFRARAAADDGGRRVDIPVSGIPPTNIPPGIFRQRRSSSSISEWQASYNEFGPKRSSSAFIPGVEAAAAALIRKHLRKQRSTPSGAAGECASARRRAAPTHDSNWQTRDSLGAQRLAYRSLQARQLAKELERGNDTQEAACVANLLPSRDDLPRLSQSPPLCSPAVILPTSLNEPRVAPLHPTHLFPPDKMHFPDFCTDTLRFSAIPSMTSETRTAVTNWMWKVVQSMRWPTSTFFIAVHAMDMYMSIISKKSTTRRRRHRTLPSLGDANMNRSSRKSLTASKKRKGKNGANECTGQSHGHHVRRRAELGGSTLSTQVQGPRSPTRGAELRHRSTRRVKRGARQEAASHCETTSPNNGENNLEKETIIPLLSTACLFLGVSTEDDHHQCQKAKYFVGQVPNVTCIRQIWQQQLRVLSTLNCGLLVNKTPHDFCRYYLANFRDVLLSSTWYGMSVALPTLAPGDRIRSPADAVMFSIEPPYSPRKPAKNFHLSASTHSPSLRDRCSASMQRLSYRQVESASAAKSAAPVSSVLLEQGTTSSKNNTEGRKSSRKEQEEKLSSSKNSLWMPELATTISRATTRASHSDSVSYAEPCDENAERSLDTVEDNKEQRGVLSGKTTDGDRRSESSRAFEVTHQKSVPQREDNSGLLTRSTRVSTHGSGITEEVLLDCRKPTVEDLSIHRPAMRAASKCSDLCRRLQSAGVIEDVVESVMLICEQAFETGLYMWLPGSRLVSAALIAVLSLVDPSILDFSVLVELCPRIFRLDYEGQVLPVLTHLAPFFRTCSTSSMVRKDAFAACLREFEGPKLTTRIADDDFVPKNRQRSVSGFRLKRRRSATLEVALL